MKLLALLLAAFLLAGCASDSGGDPTDEGTDDVNGPDGEPNTGDEPGAEPAEPVEAEAKCETVLTSGVSATIPTKSYVGAQGAGYLVIGTEAQEVYIDDNGISGLQTVESCPDNHDTKLP